MTAIAVVLLILVFIWFLAGSRRTHHYYINRYMLVMVVAAIGLFTFGAQQKSQVKTQDPYNTNTPPVAAAPYIAPTRSRIYYVKTAKEGTDGNPVLLQYYVYNKDWKYSKDELPLLKSVFGDVELIKR